MDQAIGRRWVEALRSGNYQQTTGFLRRTEHTNRVTGEVNPAGFCCLGVLCDLIAPDRWDVSDAGVDHIVPFLRTDDEREALGTVFADAMPPYDVLEASGLAEYAADVEDDTLNADDLAGRNDRGATFAEIADIIEDALARQS